MVPSCKYIIHPQIFLGEAITESTVIHEWKTGAGSLRVSVLLTGMVKVELSAVGRGSLRCAELAVE